MDKRDGLSSVLLMVSACFAAGCESTLPCDSSDCCEGDCVPAFTRGAAVPWESFDGELGPAPSGTLLLKISSSQGSCGEPWVTELACGGNEAAWEVDVPLPPALQYIGAVVDLADLADVKSPSLRQAVTEGDNCSIEESPLTGSLEVIAMNEISVTVRFSDTAPAVADLEAELTVPRCQNPELPQQAVALSETLLGTIYAPRIAGGAEEDVGAPEPAVTEPLHIFVDRSDPAGGAVCVDPRGFNAGCDPTRTTLEIVLGVDQQYPGTYSLGELVTVTSTTTSADAEGVCSEVSEAAIEGSVAVIAITPTLVHVRVDTGGPVTDAVATRCF